MKRIDIDPKTARRWVAVVLASLALGWLLSRWQVPAAWIVAGIVTAGASALASGEELPVNRTVYTFGAGIVGILAGLPLAGESLPQLLGFVLPGLVVAAFTIGMGCMAGFVLAWAQPSIDRKTGILSMLAGGASFMPAIAKEIGADIRYVALTQYLRLLAVALSLPAVTGLIGTPSGGTPASGGAVGQTWWMIVIVVAIALVGGPLGSLVKLPAPSVLGPLLLAVTLSIAFPETLNLQPPEVLRALAFLSIGWLAGGALSMTALKNFVRQLPLTVLLIAALIAACALLAVPIAAWVEINYFDAYLATSPGAIDVVLAISSESGTDPAVVAIQVTRLILILIVAASLPRIIALLSRP
ncbi:ammonia monooxygenase [Corynebacterium maris DSM 45190]|uniref:Ammonia monooxygenase n=1 Tax=Corynebacterium maris DSM 45190 TaxID=1224163 RepID=S5TKD6_9CORY|nr:AbrB family transcriptional regulator [Corynebacterium maris]AGS35356.1 ammonia monooxygenase [Corynebacterium maris DSM 45190]